MHDQFMVVCIYLQGIQVVQLCPEKSSFHDDTDDPMEMLTDPLAPLESVIEGNVMADTVVAAQRAGLPTSSADFVTPHPPKKVRAFPPSMLCAPAPPP
jgi:hypothetical protein